MAEVNFLSKFVVNITLTLYHHEKTINDYNHPADYGFL